ncbi:putative repeat protein (TIGR03943 family) [Nocardioides cavernae]|uniref:Putative repeat protein (TIGR03943 family) n=1 Tax=Nocardioides cavernae TaxID=1921566 RepID=A0A7Y9KS13_9ACTN|nr:TIGR03943 family protein [Nocardioides cavernae]NYE35338.1 putative repeat protein (TIGR03943 family) [Nocardioides cavernae]
MKRATQSLLLAVTGAVLLRMAAGDSYLRYVNSWMRWPLLACGAFLVVLALVDVLRQQGSQDDDHEAHVPRAAWLLFAPSLVFFLVAPPALGAHFAERAQSAVVPVDTTTEVDFPPLPEGDPVPIVLDEVLLRAAYDDGATLADRPLELEGFVSRDKAGTWFVTQFGMNCCAADATVMRVAATGVDAPADDQWVRVVGRHVAGTGDGGRGTPEVVVEDLELIEAPKNQYR